MCKKSPAHIRGKRVKGGGDASLSMVITRLCERGVMDSRFIHLGRFNFKKFFYQKKIGQAFSKFIPTHVIILFMFKAEKE